MTTAAKYIVFDDGLYDNPIIFPGYLEHGKIAAAFFPHIPRSAGFMCINDDETVTAYGKSESLGLEANVEIDSILLTKMFENSRA